MTPFVADGDFTLHVGNALDVLQGMPDESVHCVVTSPPYWGLRDYGTGSWVGGDPDCDHRKNAVTGRGEDFRKRGEDRGYAKGSNFANYGDRNATASDFEDTCGKCGATRTDQQLGLEPTPDAYITRMVEVFREVRRVLRRDGTCWLNIGDSYSGGSGSNVWSGDAFESDGSQRGQQPVRGKERRTPVVGMKPKDLVGIPWRLAFALQADGWYLRSDIIWAKPNPMPESVTDRPTKAHEYVFLLTREARYFYDADAIREPAEYGRREWSDPEAVLAAATNGNDKRPDHGVRVKASVTGGDPSAGRNARSVWTIATQPYAEAHFACVDAETEALTPNGWAGLDDLSDGDLIAAYNPGSDECLFEPATFHHYDYDGELVVIEKRDSSQRLTPSHTCPVRYRSGLQATVAASDLKPGMEVMTAAPLVVAQREGIGNAHASLLGWYVAEGWDTDGQQVGLSQSERANANHCETIRSLLRHVGADYRERRRDRNGGEIEWTISGDLALWLRMCGKRLTPSCVGLPKSEAQSLLDALIDGDGHRRSDGRACIVQKDRASIETMQMLALRLGYRAVLSRRKDGISVLYLTRGRWLTLRGTNGKHTPLEREHYSGVVWCPAVSTGFWLARRAGKPFITGNTFPEELPRRCISAGTSERGCCPVCGAPWERMLESQRNGVDWNRNNRQGGDRMAVGQSASDAMPRDYKAPRTTGWRPTCDVKLTAHSEGLTPVPCTVLDPFMGSGTVALVARRLGRKSIGIELNPEYAELCARRLQQQSLFACVVDESAGMSDT